MARTVGIEEELLLVDPGTGERVNLAARVLHRHRAATPGGDPARHGAADGLDPELLQHMVETRTDPTTELDRAEADVRAARRTAIDAAGAVGAAVAATGTAPLSGTPTAVTPDTRYQRIVQAFGSIGRAAGTLGMHVHVEVADDEEAVRVLDGIRPWLPVLVAVAANSPYDSGEDTGYASWRHQVWGRWPAAGPAEPFGSVEEYHRVCAALVRTGAALDEGMLYFDARIAREHPTVEVRVADVCTDVADAVLVAALTRALVETAAGGTGPDPGSDGAGPRRPVPLRTDLLRAAHWRASRDGLAGELVHPATGAPAPAREVVDALVARVRPALREAGDEDRVRTSLERIRSGGGGARLQRQAFERTGELAGVVADLVGRTAGTGATES